MIDFRSPRFKILRTYGLHIAIVLFIALHIVAPAREQISVFTFLLKIPFLAHSSFLQLVLVIIGHLLISSLAAFCCFIAVRLLGEKVEFQPFWAVLLVFFGVVAFFQPLLSKMDASWIVDAAQSVLLIAALLLVYRLSLVTSFAIWALAFLVLMMPSFFIGISHVAAGTSSRPKEARRSISALLSQSKAEEASPPSERAVKLEELHQKAEGGDAKAQADLGTAYLKDEQNLQQAPIWLSKAASQGQRDAQFELAKLYLKGDGVSQDVVTAARLGDLAAEQGNGDAEALMGQLYSHALGVPWNGLEALRHFTKARELGSIEGDTGIAELFLTGNGVARDLSKALSLYTRAAEKGSAPALYRLALLQLAGVGVPADPARAVRLLQQAARAGHPEAQYALVVLYSEGLHVPALPQTARWWGNKIKKQADIGMSSAQHYWGLIVENRFLFPEDKKVSIPKARVTTPLDPQSIYDTALKYAHKKELSHVDKLKQMAETGDGPAYYQLGELYERGEGVKKNEVQAFAFYQKSASLFYLPAFYPISRMLADGRGTVMDKSKAEEWFARIKRGAERETPAHLFNMARAYQQGLFVGRDDKKAAALYQQASAWGYVEPISLPSPLITTKHVGKPVVRQRRLTR